MEKKFEQLIKYHDQPEYNREQKYTINRLPMKIRHSILYTLIIAICWTNSIAQDRASLILDLKKAKVNYEHALNKLENDTKLLTEKAISQMEFSRSKNGLLSAEVEYQKLMLRLISEQSYIIVEKAIKYQTSSGDKRVKVTIRSSMEGNQDYLRQFKEHIDLFTPEMKSGKTYNIFVSLNSLTDKTIIGSPYEIRIPSLGLGENYDVDFRLLKDAESLQVLLNYNNKREEKNIFLEKDASTNFIDITSTQFSQEADLGSNANFDLSLERFSSSDDAFKLIVVNLPPQISYSFEDAETEARLSHLKFNQGDNLRELSLKTYLPEIDDEKVAIDKSIVFYALVIAGDHYKQIEENPYKVYSEEELNEIQGGKIKLELIPRGVGKLEIKTKSLYHELSVGEDIKTVLTIKNCGTRRVDNIKVETTNPMDWVSTISPILIRSLAPEEEVTIELQITPPLSVNVGAQEVKIKTEAYADNRRVNTEDKTLRIQVNAKTNILGTIILIVLLLGIIAGVIIFGIKFSKR